MKGYTHEHLNMLATSILPCKQRESCMFGINTRIMIPPGFPQLTEIPIKKIITVGGSTLLAYLISFEKFLVSLSIA
jgi:hypothetical protein